MVFVCKAGAGIEGGGAIRCDPRGGRPQSWASRPPVVMAGWEGGSGARAWGLIHSLHKYLPSTCFESPIVRSPEGGQEGPTCLELRFHGEKTAINRQIHEARKNRMAIKTILK